MISLRQRLGWILLPGLAGLIALGGSVLYPAVRRVLIAEFDYAQMAKLKALTTLPEPGRQGINLVFAERLLAEFQPGPDAEYFQIWLQDGTVLARSPSLGSMDLPRLIGSETQPRFTEVVLPDGKRGRMAGMGFGREPPGEEGAEYTVSVVLARDTVRLNRLLNGMLAGIILGGLILISLAGWLVHAGTRRGLEPVQNLAAQVRELDVHSLELRLPVGEHPAELRPISEQVNHLMDRIRAGFERERRFSANVAHELLTPVAELRTMAEAAQQWSGDPEATQGFAADTLETARQLEHIVTSLLSLAAAEANMAALRLEKVELAGLLAELRECFAERISEKQLRLEWAVPDEAAAVTDRVLCRSILFNLLDNAAEYSPRGGVLRCEARVKGGLEIVLANTVTNLSPADIQHLFEPLWRKDSARSARAHTGLGLSVSRSLAGALNAELEARLSQPDRLEILLRLPV